MEENESEKEDSQSLIRQKLEKIAYEIKISYARDCDRVEYMKELIEILKEILTKDSIEEFFNNDQENFTYFSKPFMNEVINMLLYQGKIYGENGDEVALEVLLNIFKLFLKFHKNNNYTNLFEIIRTIFENKRFFYMHQYDDGKEHDLIEFNSEFCSFFQKSIKKFEIGEEIDFTYEQRKERYDFLRKVWLRGKIENINENVYLISFCENEQKVIPINSLNIFEKGTKTVDWDWRLNLKQFDVIDCFDRNKWYPATVLEVIEKEKNGYKKIKYKIAFRLYIDHFKNPENENDTYEKHIDIWKGFGKAEINTDDDNKLRYIGDGTKCDEEIVFYSKRIQKFGTYSALQQKYPDLVYSYNCDEENELKRANDDLVNDAEVDVENNFYYEKEGKKNYILGKFENKFLYPFAQFLKLIEKDNGYDKFIEILKDNPTSDEIYNTFYYLNASVPYLHSGYFKENGDLIKSTCINYINNLDEKNIRKIPKELNELVTIFIYKINSYVYKEDKDKNNMEIYDEITLAFALKSIKANIFDYRLKGIKDLNDIIEKNKANKEISNNLILIIKENKIINELFGANYHSQLISKSNEIIKLLLKENALDESDMALIWSCTKRGDLEAKLTIMKLLSSLTDNLQENHIEMLLNSVISNVDKKINNEEIELVYKLSTKNEDNEKNMMHCCEYLWKIFLETNPQSPDIDLGKIMEKIILMSSKNEKYLKKILDICENGLVKNEKAIQCFYVIEQILNKYKNNENDKEKEKEIINQFIKDNHLINLFENNTKMYLAKAKKILEENKIAFTEGELISKYIIDDYTHNDNIKKRIDILPFLINEFYPEYDFLPFLKNVLLTNPVSPNDQLIFYDFIKKYISENINSNKISEETKEKFRQEIFELISENDKGDITLEQLKLFIVIFLDINKDKITLEENSENEIKEVSNIEELKGLDKLWNIIFKINEEKVLSFGVNIIYQIYKNNNIEKLFEKCNSFIKEENINKENILIEKYITFMKLIIIESEKNIFFTPKSHLSLIKHCLINIPFEIKKKVVKIKEDVEKFIVYGNTNLIDMKIIISQIYEISPNLVAFSLSKKFLKNSRKNKEEKEIKEDLLLDESYNNTTLYELILQNETDSNLLPKEKILFSGKKPEEEKLVINGEINPKLKKIFKEWFIEFTQGTMKMDEEATERFIQGVTPNKYPTNIYDQRIKNFLKEDLDNKGYVNEDEFIHFFEKALKDPRKSSTVWSNLEQMGYGKDLKKVNEKNEENNNNYFYENEKLPRYKLGNDLNFVERLIKKYYENTEKYFSLVDFLNCLSTNEKVYDDVLENLFKEEENKIKEDNDKKFFLDSFEQKNRYVELNYIFIIIESVLQDLQVMNINNNSNNFINLGNRSYNLISTKYEPFDNTEKFENKIKLIKRLIKSENFQKIINHINDSLEYLSSLIKENKSPNTISKIYDFCLRGIKILNTIYNYFSINNEKENPKLNINQTGVYYLGYMNVSQLFEGYDFQKELDNISYNNLSDNLIKLLTNTSKEEKDNNLKKECFDLLIKILSNNKQLLENYNKENDTQKNIINKLFIDKFSNNEEMFIQNIIISVANAEKNKNKNYIELLSKLVNSLLDKLINPENKAETDNDKRQFAPDNSFFELYSHLHKLKSEENKNTINQSSFNIYELVMKNITDKTHQNKLFLSLLQLLNLQISSDESIKKEILFKEQEGNDNLFNFLFEHAMPELLKYNKKEKKEEKEKLISSSENDTNNTQNENYESKFILLENIKEEKEETTEDNFSEELSQICNEFLLNIFKNTDNPKLIAQLLRIINMQREYDKKNSKRKLSNDNRNTNNIKTFELTSKSSSMTSKKFGHVGLKNLGCICYMNSIMQQMYMVPTFRYAIMAADDHKEPNPVEYSFCTDDNLLHQLQNMYTYLTFSNKSDFEPRDFVFSYKDFDGKPTNVRMQQDSQEFYNNFCDKIENCLKLTKYKYIVSDVFMGQSCSSVECSNCKNISNRFEDFYNLTLEVKNISNLNDSLQKMSVPEIIDDFKCSNCNQKVRISKMTSLNKLPNVLVVHLKRFYLNYEVFKTMKINSKYEFPKKLNLKQFCVSELQKNSTNKNNEIYFHEDDYYEYELKGINVHTGSADGGHYFSFIDVNRDGKNNIINNYQKEYWLQFNDSKVSEFDTETIPKECYGGISEGYSYENIQNAYLLIYERKKKTPIRVLFEKEETKKINKENNPDLIVIKKENRSEINKKYDLSRLNIDDIKEEDLYKKIFFDEEKDEYYKYIPFYNVTKYAPRKTYEYIMIENNTKEETSDITNDKFLKNKQNYGQILSDLISSSKFDINNKYYDDKMKEAAILSSLDELLMSIKSKEQYVGEEGNNTFNEGVFSIFNNLIKPIVNKNTNDELLETVFDMICNTIFLKFIFTSNYKDGFKYLDKVTNKTNAKLVMDIFYEFVKIFYNKKKETKNINFYLHLFEIIKQSNNGKGIREDNEGENKYEYTIIFAYQLLEKLIHANDEVLQDLIERKIISILFEKITVENEEIKKIIYSSLKYIIKSTNEYTKELFDLDEKEKEGRNISISDENLQEILGHLEIIKVLIEDDLELFIIFIVISSKNDSTYLRNLYFMGLTKLIDYLIERNIDKNEIISKIIKILYSLSIVNDKEVLQRYQYILGYPNPIIVEIPTEESDTQTQNQKWPLFGEKLINGNIDKQIYEFVNINHKNKNLCLLRLLLPNENDKNEEDVQIPKDTVINIIKKLIKNCLGEKSNYSLFKYLYLNPGRSLRYENLYQEMKQIVLNEDKEFNFDEYKDKEMKFIEQIQKEVDKAIKELKEEDREDNDQDEDEDENPPPISGEIDFNCEDEKMKKFIGFNCNIIPGEIVREEIVQIANGDYLGMYRLEYYTKYFDTKELREKLLNPDKKENETVNTNNKDKNEKDKEEKNEKTPEKNIQEESKQEKQIETTEEKTELDKEIKEETQTKVENKEKDGEKNEEKKEEEKKAENIDEKEKTEEKKDDTEEEAKKNIEQNKNENKNETKEEEIPKEQSNEEKNKEESPTKEDKKEETPKQEDTPKEETKEEETKETPEANKNEDSQQDQEENTNIETEIDDSLELREQAKNKIVRKYDISSMTEDKIIYDILPKRESSIILEDKNIKDKNKVKRVLFRYIFTNKSNSSKAFRATVFLKQDFTKIKQNNCCILNRFNFDIVNGENMTNFYNIMRIRGDLPFMERDNITLSIDIMDDINFRKS